MYIKKFNIKNFKSFKDVTFHFNADVNILTGRNNTGKTTVLEALALWHECFGKLLQKAKRNENKYGYKSGDWILGLTHNLFIFNEINNVRTPNIEDIFYQRNSKSDIILSALISNKENTNELEIPFIITTSTINYDISLYNYTKFDYQKFNIFFKRFPEPIGKYYASPVTSISQSEDFVTVPQIKDAILNRKSSNILRNQLYRLLKFPLDYYIEDFINYLSQTIGQNIELLVRSDIQKDKKVVINFKFSKDVVEKDIALVGSGTLQIIEILLNLFQPIETFNNLHFYEQNEIIKDFNIVLLDEPDSHIHREIQKKLTELLTKFSKTNQIFISTHNESLIRSASYNHLFHLDGKKEAEIKSIEKIDIAKNIPHFKGIYPAQINSIIKSLGDISGLDFVNAIESQKLIFVEGEEDAKILSLLFKHQFPSTNKKFMFWVLGGISTALENLNSYKTVFSSIKNEKTLWEKSIFIFDKDYLSLEHKEIFCEKLIENLGLKSYSWNSYTFESTLLTEIDKFLKLLTKFIFQKHELKIEIDDLSHDFYLEYQNFKSVLEQRFTDNYYKETYFRYKDLINGKSEKLFGKKLVQLTEPDLMNYIKQNNNEIIESGKYYKLISKNDLEILINKVLNKYSLSFSSEIDFVELIKLVDKSLWFDEWDFLLNI